MPPIPIDDGDGARPRQAGCRKVAGAGSLRGDAAAAKEGPSAEHAERVARAHALTQAILTSGEDALPARAIESGDVRIASVLYMTYWFHRFRDLPAEQKRIEDCLVGYLGGHAADRAVRCAHVLRDAQLEQVAREYVTELLLPIRTVDLVVIGDQGPRVVDRQVLCLQRQHYPFGHALPGGIVRDDDETNPLGVPAPLFAALRVAGEKVLRAHAPSYSTEQGPAGRLLYVVGDPARDVAIVIHPDDRHGYRYRENIRTVFRPSDPRHIVDTIGFRCELRGAPPREFTWRSRSEVLSATHPAGGFAFGHHREIVNHVAARTSLEAEQRSEERDFIRSIVDDPVGVYRKLAADFASHARPQLAPRPELFPVVHRLLRQMYAADVNDACRRVPVLAGVRDKATVGLRQVALKNRTFCPYLPTLHAIMAGVAFFDLLARHKRGFYDAMPKDRIVEHDPATTAGAAYHTYRYKYRLDELLQRTPYEIVWPTFEALSATDIMRVRAVPIRFLGLSTDFTYVDEFEQSPEEFMMHDANHSYRMVEEDDRHQKAHGRTRDAYIDESARFSREYLDRIRVRKEDSERERELKKLKKIILFEIVHEDARPFLRDVVCRHVQQQEGGAVPFEVPHVDAETGYMDIVDTVDVGISTLSYVRNKLQHGFYDHADALVPQIVAPAYRTAEWIARAAYELLVELDATPAAHAELDDSGRVSLAWLLKRACSVGPDNRHEAVIEDPTLARHPDEAQRLNPKKYQA